MKKAFVTLLSVVVFAACGAPPAPTNTDVSPEPTSSVPVNLNKGGVEYREYSDKLVGRGKSSVLFFAKEGDPFSIRSDAAIRAIYGTGAAVVTTYRLDYPTSTGARIKYGVVVEDTFVLLDAQGQRVTSLIHPTVEEIRIILRGNIPVSAQ